VSFVFDPRAKNRHARKRRAIGTSNSAATASAAGVALTRGASNCPLRSIDRLHASPRTSSTITRPSARRIVIGYGSMTSP
jgi:hypothetical protein